MMSKSTEHNEQGQDDLVVQMVRHPNARSPKRDVMGLTCNEGSVDVLLSEGESI